MANNLTAHCKEGLKQDQSKTSPMPKNGNGSSSKSRFTPIPPAIQRKIVTRLITYLETK